MLIGEVARRSGVPTGAIRFYERHQLITPAARSSAGYRLYDDRAVGEIAFIKKAQQLSFSLDEIRDVLRLGRQGRKPCDRVVTLCQTHLADVNQRMAELVAARQQLQATLDLAQSGCGWTIEGFCQAIMAESESESNRKTP